MNVQVMQLMDVLKIATIPLDLIIVHVTSVSVSMLINEGAMVSPEVNLLELRKFLGTQRI